MNFYGSVFKITRAGVLTTLVSFKNDDGATPTSPLLLGSDGNLYGTTSEGGTFGMGTVFKIVMPSSPSSVSLTATLAGSKIILSWQTNAAGYALQSRLNFTQSAGWADSPSVPVILGAQFRVTNSIRGNSVFYRLRK